MFLIQCRLCVVIQPARRACIPHQRLSARALIFASVDVEKIEHECKNITLCIRATDWTILARGWPVFSWSINKRKLSLLLTSFIILYIVGELFAFQSKKVFESHLFELFCQFHSSHHSLPWPLHWYFVGDFLACASVTKLSRRGTAECGRAAVLAQVVPTRWPFYVCDWVRLRFITVLKVERRSAGHLDMELMYENCTWRTNKLDQRLMQFKVMISILL